MPAEGDTLWWDDLTEGRSWAFGSERVTTQEIIAFARRYDPQVMHLDPVAAADTPLGVFCASGIQTLGMAQRMLVDNLFARCRLIAGRGNDHFRLHRPVVPGDVLSLRVRVTAQTPHARRADAGWIKLHVETLRGDGKTVMDYTCEVLFERRPAGT